MMVNFSALLTPQRVNIGVKDNLNQQLRNFMKTNFQTSKKGIIRLKISQISTILIYEVLGRFCDTDMNMVARTCIREIKPEVRQIMYLPT